MTASLEKIALIGFGEVGQTLTKNLKDAGIRDITAWDIAFASPASAQSVAAKKLGVTIAKSMDEALRGQSLVIAAVTAGSAEAAAAQAAPLMEKNALYADVNSVSPGAKQRIGKAVAELVEEGQTVILDGGSTVAEVAQHLQGRSLQIITNSIPIAQIFYDSKSTEVTLTGGFLYPRLGVLLGPLCEQMLDHVSADILIMGIGGITEAGLSNSNTLIVGSERKMIEVSRTVIVAADHSKFGRNAMVHLSSLDKVDLVVSDGALAPKYHQLLERHKVGVVLA